MQKCECVIAISQRETLSSTTVEEQTRGWRVDGTCYLPDLICLTTYKGILLLRNNQNRVLKYI